jgi:hypothetical protein
MSDSDTAEADRLDQVTPVDAAAGGDDEIGRPRALTPLEADEGDALEQAIDVPLDDDYPPDS